MNKEHKHEWRMMPCSWNMQVFGICANEDCGKELDSDEIERCLNKFEELQEAFMIFASTGIVRMSVLESLEAKK